MTIKIEIKTGVFFIVGPPSEGTYRKNLVPLERGRLEKEFQRAAEMTTNEYGQQAAQMWTCGKKNIDQADLVLVPAMALTKLIPGREDDVVVYAIVIIKTVGTFAALAAAGYLIGNSIAYSMETVSADQATATELVDLSTLETVSIEETVSEIHNPDHDVTSPKNIPVVTTMTATFQTWVATGGPRNRNDYGRFVCKALVIAGKAARYYLLEAATSNMLVWTPDGSWLTFFPQTSGKVTVPQNIAEKYKDAQIQAADCNTLPPFPPLGA